MALDAITSVVPIKMVASLVVKETTLEAWKAVKTMWISSESVRKTKVQRLSCEIELIRFTNGKSVDDFMVRLQNLIAALGTVRETMEPNKVVEKLLRVVPKHLSTGVIAIEIMVYLAMLMLGGVGGRMCAVEDHVEEDDEVPLVHADSRLYLNEDQWEARWCKHREKEQACSGSACHDNGDRKGGHSGSHEDDSDDDNGGSSFRSGATGHHHSSGKGRCFNCSVRGHFSRECPKPTMEEALFVSADEEPTLL
ncbi:unnamed protein product [Urochloa humidicola]